MRSCKAGFRASDRNIVSRRTTVCKEFVGKESITNVYVGTSHGVNASWVGDPQISLGLIAGVSKDQHTRKQTSSSGHNALLLGLCVVSREAVAYK
jgi:hypothetical protein